MSGGGGASWMRPLAVFASALPALALLACVSIAVHYHAEDTLATHCRNVNRLPSISAAVGQHSPEKRIWSISIAVSCALRLLVAAAYRQEITARLPGPWGSAGSSAASLMPGAHFGLGCLELASLLGLSVIASSDNYAIHRNCFVTFLLSSFAYMILHLWIVVEIRSQSAPSSQRVLFTTKCFLIKLMTLACYCASILLAVYFYARHQAYCEDMMYTYFAAAEYSVVYANILFHLTAYSDLGNLPIRLVIVREFRQGYCQSRARNASRNDSYSILLTPDSASHWDSQRLKRPTTASSSSRQSRIYRHATINFDAESPGSSVTHSFFVGL